MLPACTSMSGFPQMQARIQRSPSKSGSMEVERTRVVSPIRYMTDVVQQMQVQYWYQSTTDLGRWVS